MLANLQTAYGEASEVHMGASGYFAVFRKQAPKGKKQKLYAVSEMEAVMRAARHAPDTYVSQASFISAASRRISSVSSMGCAFVDIDCYKLGLAPDDRLVEQILGCAAQLNLPEPTYVVSSGRGLYVKWLFTEQMPAAQISRWQRLQAVLIPLYRALGSDPGVRDAARVLRAVETINSSADNAVVRVVHASGRRVAFDDLWNAVASIDSSSLSDISSDRVAKTTAKMIERKVRAAAAGSMTDKEAIAFESSAKAHLLDFSQSHEPIMLPAQACMANLNWRRFVDLRDLCLMRGGPRRGSRDMNLFWMANFLGLSGVVNASNLDHEINDLAASFEGFGRDFKPVEDGSMSMLRERLALRAAGRKVVFRNAEFDALYTPTNEHLIDLFEISPDEQRRLSTIIGDQEKLRRADAKVPGRAERRQERFDLGVQARSIAAEMKEAGGRVVISQIAERIGVSRWAVTRLLNQPLNAQERRKRKTERLRAAGVHRAGPVAAASRVIGQSYDEAGAASTTAITMNVAASATTDAGNVFAFAFARPNRAELDGLAAVDRSNEAVDGIRGLSRDECAVFSVSKGRREERGVTGAIPNPSFNARSTSKPSIPRIPPQTQSSDGSGSQVDENKSLSAKFENSAASSKPSSRKQTPLAPARTASGRLTLVGAVVPDGARAASFAAARALTHDVNGQERSPEEVLRECEIRRAERLQDQAERDAAAERTSRERFQVTLDKVIALNKKRLATDQAALNAQPTGAVHRLRGGGGGGDAVEARTPRLDSPFAPFVKQVLNQRSQTTARNSPNTLATSTDRVTSCVTKPAKHELTADSEPGSTQSTGTCVTSCVEKSAKYDVSQPDGGSL